MGNKMLLILSLLTFAISSIKSQEITPSTTFVTIGGNETLICHHPLLPNATVRWFRGGPGSLANNSALLTTHRDARLVQTDSSLFISSFDPLEHAGEYSCIVEPSNEVEQSLVSCPARIKHAHIQTALLVEPKNTTAFVGTNAVLHCNPAQSLPPAHISWTRNGQALDTSTNGRFQAPSGNLYITTVSTSDGGLYQCVARNSVTGVSVRSQEVVLTIEAPIENMTETTPTFIVEPVNTTATVGERVILECAGQGYPQPSESWQKFNSRTFPTGEHIEGTGALVIERVSLTNAGIYICRIRNQNGEEVDRRIITLTVQEPPHFTGGPPPHLSVSRGDAPVNISCAAASSDSLDLYLLSMGRVIHRATSTGGGDITIQTSVGYSSTSSSQTYQCIAVNTLKCISTKILVTFIDSTTPSEATTPTSVSGATPTEISVSEATPTKVSTNISHETTPTLVPINETAPTEVSVTPTTSDAPSTSNATPTTSDTMSNATSTTSDTMPTSNATPTTSDAMPTASNATPTTSDATPSGSNSTPTFGLSTERPGSNETMPALSIQTSSPSVMILVGSRLQMMCQAKAPRNWDIKFDWFFDGETRPLESNETAGLQIIQTKGIQAKEEEISIETSLIINPVSASHEGTYTCRFFFYEFPSEINPRQLHGDIVVHVLPPPLTTSSTSSTTTTTSHVTSTESVTMATPARTQSTSVSTGSGPTPTGSGGQRKPPNPPRNLSINKYFVSDGISISWSPPAESEVTITGYKINWNTQNLIRPVARFSIARNGSQDEYRYSISMSFDTSVPLLVYVWAYNIHGDGPYASAELQPITRPSTLTTSNTPTTPTTMPPTTTTPPTAPPTTPFEDCTAIAANSTSIHLQWPEIFTDSVEVRATCFKARSTHLVSVPSSTSSSFAHIIDQVLPNCSYIIQLQSSRRRALCSVSTPNGQVDVRESVQRFPNGTIRLDWHLPPEIRNDQLSIEANWGRGWVPITSGLHALAHFEPNRQYQVQLRFRHGGWEGHLNVTIPPSEGTTNEGPSINTQTEVALIYGVIFGIVLIGCVLLVAIILGLKYVQWKRREKDKITNYREKSKEEFDRMSSKRSSMTSIKSSKTSDV